MPEEIQSWRSLTGDSTVRDISLSDGALRFLYEDYWDMEFQVTVVTDAAVIRGGPEIHPVYARLVTVSDYLPIHHDSGIFVAPTDFGKLMQAAREGATLALGRRSTEWPFIFQIRGSENWLTCVVKSEASIQVAPVNDDEVS